MTKEFTVQSDVVPVEIYMADQDPPAIYDLFILRTGEIRRAPSTIIPGLIQVVMAGSSPSGRQVVTVRRHFELDQRFRLLKFY